MHKPLRFLAICSLAALASIAFSLTLSAQTVAYVADRDDNNVSVINTSTNMVMATVGVGEFPMGVAITPDERRAYVTNFASNNVSVINIPTNQVIATVGVGQAPLGVAITPDGRRAYVTNRDERTVSVIDTSNNTLLVTLVTGESPWAVAITPDGRRAFVTNAGSNNVSVINTLTNTVTTTVPVGRQPAGLAITPDGRLSYVANLMSNDVSVINTLTSAVVGTVRVGTYPYSVAITPDGRRAYVVNQASSDVSVIDISSNTVVATVSVGALVQPVGIAITSDGGRAYVTNQLGNNVSVIDTSNNTVVATVPVGARPQGIAFATLNQIVTCGTTIDLRGTYDLAKDLHCTGVDGIDIDADSVTLELHGHTITGSSTNAGIRTSGPLIRIHDGKINSFSIGVLTESGLGVRISDVTVAGASVAGFVARNGSVVFWTDDTAERNPIGFLLLTDNSQVEHCNAFSNSEDGFQIGGARNDAVFENSADYNGAIGIHVTGTDGYIHDNRASHNTTFDLADQNPNCDNNTWEDNVFNTRNQDCIH